MSTVLPLDKMSVEEKLRIMDEIWTDLSRNENNIPVPQWHLDLLRERERMVTEGKARFIDWEDAKKQLYERTRSPHEGPHPRPSE